MLVDDDGLPLDKARSWAKEKHERLRKYVDISRGVRKKFVTGSGGASYIDLFCGSGRARIKDTGELIDGSPMVAHLVASSRGVPFTQIHIADTNELRRRAARQRIATAGGAVVEHEGDAESVAQQLAADLNHQGLHFAFLDPYNLGDLPFSVIEALGQLKHMDMLNHVSTQDLRRNLDRYMEHSDVSLDRFAPGWRDAVDPSQGQQAIRAGIVEHWKSKIKALGLLPADSMELVTGDRSQPLYWLAFVSRHELAQEFWEKIRNISGQKDLFPTH